MALHITIFHYVPQVHDYPGRTESTSTYRLSLTPKSHPSAINPRVRPLPQPAPVPTKTQGSGERLALVRVDMYTTDNTPELVLQRFQSPTDGVCCLNGHLDPGRTRNGRRTEHSTRG